MANQKRDTFKYHFKVGNVIVHKGITDDLSRREAEHRASGRWILHNGKRLYWSNGHIVKVGRVTTRERGLDWEREQGV